ncbi:MAG TPA: hypothetical protein DCS63_06930 [Elusimicrobia bacterium]|nr:hypothetical protein [Elusimicrobiota bacterium]
MNNWKEYVFAAVIVTASGFAYVKDFHKDIPADLRDAVAGRGDFDTTIPAMEKDSGNIPVPKLETGAIVLDGKRFTGLSVLPDEDQSVKPSSGERPATTGKGALLQDPQLDGCHFLALNAGEQTQFVQPRWKQIQEGRATALCGLLGYGAAVQVSVVFGQEDKAWFDFAPNGSLFRAVYRTLSFGTMSGMRTVYPARLKEVTCAPKEK